MLALSLRVATVKLDAEGDVNARTAHDPAHPGESRDPGRRLVRGREPCLAYACGGRRQVQHGGHGGDAEDTEARLRRGQPDAPALRVGWRGCAPRASASSVQSRAAALRVLR